MQRVNTHAAAWLALATLTLGGIGATSATPTVTVKANNDLIVGCGSETRVNLLANDRFDGQASPKLTLDSVSCPGTFVEQEPGVFDFSEVLGEANECRFNYSLATARAQSTATVTVGRASQCRKRAGGLPLLRIHPDNPRYFADSDNNVVFLAGAHVWQNLQDYGPLGTDNFPPTNCGGHECGAEEWNYLRGFGHNFTRGWHWEHPQSYGNAAHWHTFPVPFAKRNGKYDLYSYDAAYFSRLHQRIQSADSAGLYVSLMLFEGFSARRGKNAGADNAWLYHPFNPDNNINFAGIDVDLDCDGGGEETHSLLVDEEVTEAQRAYITKMVEEFNHYDNIIWEICNECGNPTPAQQNPADCKNPSLPLHRPSPTETYDWMNTMAAYLKSEDARVGKSHLVWMSSGFNTGVDNGLLYASQGNVLGLRGTRNGFYTFHNNPPDYVADSTNMEALRPVLLDSDHVYNPYCVAYNDKPHWCDSAWPWKVFLAGYNPVFMDTTRTLPPFNGNTPSGHHTVQDVRYSLGQTVDFANLMIGDLAAMTPQGDLSSTGYTLANPGQEYLVLQPGSGAFTLDMVAGEYDFTWFSINANNGAGAVVNSGTYQAINGGNDFLQSGHDLVLHLTRTYQGPPPAVSLSVDPEVIGSGESTDVSWQIDNEVFDLGCLAFEQPVGHPETRINPGFYSPSGTYTIYPIDTTTYRVECDGPGGSGEDTVTVTVAASPVVSLSASPDTVAPGDPSVVSWQISNPIHDYGCIAYEQVQGLPETVYNPGFHGSSGTHTVYPTLPTTYRVECEGPGGFGEDSVTIEIIPAPIVNLSVDPIVINAGQNSVLSWHIQNEIFDYGCVAYEMFAGQPETVFNPGFHSTAGSLTFTPPRTVRYRVVCEGPGGSGTDLVVIHVN